MLWTVTRFPNTYVGPAIGIGAAGDDDRVQQCAVELVSEPAEMAYITVVDAVRELDFHRKDPVIPPLHDHANLVVARVRAQAVVIAIATKKFSRSPRKQAEESILIVSSKARYPEYPPHTARTGPAA